MSAFVIERAKKGEQIDMLQNVNAMDNIILQRRNNESTLDLGSSKYNNSSSRHWHNACAFIELYQWTQKKERK